MKEKVSWSFPVVEGPSSETAHGLAKAYVDAVEIVGEEEMVEFLRNCLYTAFLAGWASCENEEQPK